MKTKIKISVILSTFFFVVLIPQIKCQITIDTSVLFISARSGLNLRNAPTVNSEKIISGQYGQAVQPIEVVSEEIKLDDKKGNWLKVRYNEKIGFMFSGYLSKLPRLDNQLFHKQTNVGHPIAILSKYFRLVLFEIQERKTKIIQECGNDPDCKNGISQEIRFMNKGFNLIETTGWELYEEEVIGNNWPYGDAKDLVDWIVYPLWKEEVEFQLEDNACTYTKKDGQHGFVSFITIKKISERETSISWGGYH